MNTRCRYCDRPTETMTRCVWCGGFNGLHFADVKQYLYLFLAFMICVAGCRLCHELVARWSLVVFLLSGLSGLVLGSDVSKRSKVKNDIIKELAVLLLVEFITFSWTSLYRGMVMHGWWLIILVLCLEPSSRIRVSGNMTESFGWRCLYSFIDVVIGLVISIVILLGVGCVNGVVTILPAMIGFMILDRVSGGAFGLRMILLVAMSTLCHVYGESVVFPLVYVLARGVVR